MGEYDGISNGDDGHLWYFCNENGDGGNEYRDGCSSNIDGG